MRSALITSALVALALAAPRPQSFPFEAIDAAVDEDLGIPEGPPLAAASTSGVSGYDANAVIEAAAASVTEVAERKRSLVEARQASCSPLPLGPGPVPTPDTPAAFRNDPRFPAAAKSAVTPPTYRRAFVNLDGATQQKGYLSFANLPEYNPALCAERCDRNPRCIAFNIYFERDPTGSGDACPNPPSTTNIKCSLYGAPVDKATATNRGQFRRKFEIVIAGSNGYNTKSLPGPVEGYDGPVPFDGAINAPDDSYMGLKDFPGAAYDPEVCTTACTETTAYNKRHPAEDGSFNTCVFVNAWMSVKDGKPTALHCSLYSRPWGAEFATNVGQFRDGHQYTVAYSNGYYLQQGTK